MKYGWNKGELMSKKKIYFDLIAEHGIQFLNQGRVSDSIKYLESENYYNLLLSILSDYRDNSSVYKSFELFNLMKEEFSDETLLCEKDRMIEFKICQLLNNCINCVKPAKLTELSMLKDDYIRLSGDMIKSKIDNEHYLTFKNLFINKKNNVMFSNEHKSFFFYNAYNGDCHALIHEYNNINETVDIAHEAGHYYRNCINPLIVKQNNGILSEVESLWYELLMYEFLVEENICKKDANSLILELLYNLELEAVIIGADLKFPFYKMTNIKEFKKSAHEYDIYKKSNTSCNNELLNLIYNIKDEDSFNYIYSFMVVLELYSIYQNNKREGIRAYDKFISRLDSGSDYDFVKDLNADYITFNNLDKYRKYKEKVLARM